MDEFTLIKAIFQPLQSPEGAESYSDSENTFLMKIGDDAAVWKGHGNLAFSIDTLVEGVHFTPNIPPQDLGYRALAVNLSDLAAMSAEPEFFTLAITLPKSDSEWLMAFAQGMAELANQFGVALVGGDTTRGPLTITIQAHGLCPQPVYRHGAQVGDDVYVSGCLGDAAAGLKLWLDGISHSKELSGDESYLVSRFHRPTPRVELGMALKGIAHAMLDISDGLLSDLTHIAKASQVSVVIDECNLPLSESVLRCFDQPQAVRWALSGGDDYELAFTAPSDMRQELENIALDLGVRLTRIGQVIQSDDEHKVFVSNASEAIVTTGYNHFSD